MAATAAETPAAPPARLKPFQRNARHAEQQHTRGRHQQEGNQRADPMFRLRGNETLGQLLENQEAENYHGRGDCQGQGRAPAEGGSHGG